MKAFRAIIARAVFEMKPLGTATKFCGEAAAWAAILSGLFGVATFGFLIAALKSMWGGEPVSVWTSRFVIHDVGLVLQSLFLVPSVFAVYRIAPQRSPAMNRVVLGIGLASLLLTVVCLVLDIRGVLWNSWYMLPQAFTGAWILLLTPQPLLPRWLKVLAAFVAVGLIVVGAFPVGYAAFVDPIVLHGPPDPLSEAPQGTERADSIVHALLLLGTLIGVALYPIFAIFFGRTLLSDRSAAREHAPL